jgi:hypothetical protein
MTKTALILLFIFASLKTSAQSAGPLRLTSSSNFENISTTDLYRLQKGYLEKIYFNSVTAPNELINGKEYQPYYYKSGTNPLLNFKSNRTATLFFRDMQFKNLSLHYDTYLDEVIYTDNNRIVDGRCPQIALNRDIIKGFNLYFDNDSLIFRYFQFPEKDAEKMKNGFYEVAYDGKTTFLIRHRSTLYNKEGLDKYEYSPERYILSGDKWFKITSQKSFLKIFGNREQEISDILHKSKVRVPKAAKAQLVQILRNYDSSDNSVK